MDEKFVLPTRGAENRTLEVRGAEKRILVEARALEALGLENLTLRARTDLARGERNRT